MCFQGAFRVTILAPMPPYAGVFSGTKISRLRVTLKHSVVIMCHYRTVGSGLYGNHMITVRLARSDCAVCIRSRACIRINSYVHRDENGEELGRVRLCTHTRGLDYDLYE